MQMTQTSGPVRAEQQFATRTQGFWNTHGSDNLQYGGYTCHVFTDHLGSFINLGWDDEDHYVRTGCLASSGQNPGARWKGVEVQDRVAGWVEAS